MAQDDEYPAGVSDARLAACQQDVLKMVELAAQVAEGLAANVDPEAEGAPWTVDVTCPWCENPISLAVDQAGLYYLMEQHGALSLIHI